MYNWNQLRALIAIILFKNEAKFDLKIKYKKTFSNNKVINEVIHPLKKKKPPGTTPLK